MRLISGWFLAATLLGALHPIPRSLAASDIVDGFIAYCTGNHDGTGLCENEETGQSYTCQIILGSVIDCKSTRSQKPFQCIWISSSMPNGAQFWCDKDVDQMLREDFAVTITDKEFKKSRRSIKFFNQRSGVSNSRSGA